MLHPKVSIALSALALTPFAASTTYPDFVHPSNGDCKDYIVNSTVTWPQLQWNQTIYKNNFEVVAVLAKIAEQGKVPFSAFSGSKNVTMTFQTAGTFCKPKVLKDGKEDTVLVATHGAGFDRRYWASSYKPEDYNFAQYALAAGYSIFYYDRLGVGHSSRLSGYEVEAGPQIELLASILRSLRFGHYTQDIKPSKLVLIGHSFGSAISNNILGRYPDLADAAILTGYAFPSMEDPAFYTSGLGLSVFGSRIVSTLPPSSKPQFANTFDDGWLSFVDKFAFTESFLGGEDYEVPAAEYSFKIAQPYSAVDFLSAFAQMTVADKFEGKVLFAPAERDLFFCAGDCKDTYARGVQGRAFPNNNTEVYFQEGSGHGQNFALNAKDMYGEVVKFVDSL
ncbi:uncharacterized protein N0V89_011988 [Didymosphaeria variabile]|uniref:AB hydrolase-1 domain-containing protein n=1 Tax=Didymosphaeria variabile TaxID=1932322 RepID=A0A9W8XCA7_9PLEO|nr:uncharacterized protein N0V89_011988 [Didymosphaeria variabile]KAJ4345853.1 hypothetical protein N0V89_011988 [Didymosphaeria variabile]